MVRGTEPYGLGLVIILLPSGLLHQPVDHTDLLTDVGFAETEFGDQVGLDGP